MSKIETNFHVIFFSGSELAIELKPPQFQTWILRTDMLFDMNCIYTEMFLSFLFFHLKKMCVSHTQVEYNDHILHEWTNHSRRSSLINASTIQKKKIIANCTNVSIQREKKILNAMSFTNWHIFFLHCCNCCKVFRPSKVFRIWISDVYHIILELKWYAKVKMMMTIWMAVFHVIRF